MRLELYLMTLTDVRQWIMFRKMRQYLFSVEPKEKKKKDNHLFDSYRLGRILTCDYFLKQKCKSLK